MPWQETCVMTLKEELIYLWLDGVSKTELARAFDISRPTVDKWLKRYHEYGLSGLQERSRRPNHSPAAISDDIKYKLIALKCKHSQFGPKKIVDRFKMVYPHLACPADSTVGEILLAVGLVKPRRNAHKTPYYPDHLTQSEYPSEVWNADFKGDVRLKDKKRCYPLTISDDYSRYLLCCHALSSTCYSGVQPQFERLFKIHGLPDAIKTDNGVPFSSTAIGGLSRLSKWFIQLGIRPERIEKGKPTQNGRHERMHKSLKAHAMTPPEPSMYTQQVAFERFRQEYNHERSHESLDRKTPGQVFRRSIRDYSKRIKPIEYDSKMTIRQVRHNGEIRFKGEFCYVSGVLAKEPVGLIETETGYWEIYYSFQKIAIFNEKRMKVEPLKAK